MIKNYIRKFFQTFMLLIVLSKFCSNDVLFTNSTENNIDIDSDNSTSDEEFICLTPTCVKEASKIIQSLDESVNPCDDFYQFACGKWIESTPIPAHKSAFNSFVELQDLINYRIKGLLENIDLKTEKRDFVIKTKQYYQSCMNTILIEERDNKPLLDLLSKLSDNDWPIQNTTANTTDFHWTDLYVKLRDLGLINNMLFSLTQSTDIRNNTQKVLTLDQPSFGMSRNLLLKEDNDLSFNAYRNLILKSALKLTNNENNSIDESLNDTIDSIIQFESNLANISMSREERRNLTFIIYEMDDQFNDDISLDNSMTREERDYLKSVYNRINITKLTQLSPNIDWLKMIQNFTFENITESDEIILNDSSFIRKLDRLLYKTDNRLLVNYMLWRVIQSKQLTLSRDWMKMRHEFEFVIHGTKKAKPRWQHCLKTVDNGLQLVLSHLYAKHYLSPDTKQKASELIESVKIEFKNTLMRTEWIDTNTLNKALDKLDRMRIMVAYPEQILEESNLSQQYEMLTLNSSDFFGNILSVNEWKQNILYKSQRKQYNIHDWRRTGSLTRANAFYNTVKNMVLIPAGILHGMFYNKDRPNYLNFGAIAKTAAHEIIHGFDNHGRHFDALGNFNYWWDGDTDQKYREKAKCFVRQYGEYLVESLGLKVNGMQTQAENIADNSGIKLAFRAYKGYVEKFGLELELPALNYTPEQLFWISYGVHYCAKQNIENLRNLVLNDSHTPKKYRINGALSNSEEFSRSFNCSIGSPMNPINKCSIW